MYKKEKTENLWGRPRDLIIYFRSKLICFFIFLFYFFSQMIEGNFVIGFFLYKISKRVF